MSDLLKQIEDLTAINAKIIETAQEHADENVRLRMLGRQRKSKQGKVAASRKRMAEGVEHWKAEAERLQDWLRCIHDILDEEIGLRFRTSSHRTEEEVGKNSKVYALLSPFRNMARTALKGEPYIKPVSHQQKGSADK